MNQKRLMALERRFGAGSPECFCQVLKCATDNELDRAIQVLASAGDGEIPAAELRRLEELEAEWRRRYRSTTWR